MFQTTNKDLSIDVNIATKKEIIFYVVNYLLNQKVRAYDKACQICSYKDDEGNKCGIGCLIPDSEYNSYIEEKSINTLIDIIKTCAFRQQGLICSDDIGDDINHIPNTIKILADRFSSRFLTILQHYHDNVEDQNKGQLRYLKNNFSSSLTKDEMKELWENVKQWKLDRKIK
jgi:hypothetical protein